jgi:hypothetical protein
MAAGSRTFAPRFKAASAAGVFRIVRVADGAPETKVQLGAIQDHLLRMDSLDRVQGYEEVAGVLDINHQLRPSMRLDLPDSAEGVLSVGDEDLKSLFDPFAHFLVSDASRAYARLGCYRKLRGVAACQE